MNLKQINELCQELSEEANENKMVDLIDELETEEFNAMMLALGPRAFAPDVDEGADDYNGLFYWDLK
jgi:hypothetical protein